MALSMAGSSALKICEELLSVMDENTSNASLTKNHEYVDLIRRPESLLLLLNKYIEVRLIKNRSFQGFVQAIDPISNSLLLLIPRGDSFRTSLIPGHAVISLSEVAPEPHIKLPERKPTTSPVIDITERKARVIAWLKQNLLPVSESGDKILFGSASLLPPYTAVDICTSNPMVVMQMRKIIERMPEDFDPQKPIS